MRGPKIIDMQPREFGREGLAPLCPHCQQPMVDLQRRWWRRIRTWVLYGWIVGLGILAAEIVIEAQMISRQWELFDRTVKLLDLKAQTVRGR